MDESGSRARIKSMIRPPDLKELEQEIAAINGQKKLAVGPQKYEEAANLRDREKRLKESLDATLAEWEKCTNEKIVEIGEPDITLCGRQAHRKFPSSGWKRPRCSACCAWKTT